jgi:localization factor PodJL
MAEMKPGVPWSVKGIEPEAREAAKDAARRAGMTLGQWLNQRILDQEAEAGRSSAPAARQTPTPRERASSELAMRLDALNRRLDTLADDRGYAAPDEPAAPRERWAEPAPASAPPRTDLQRELRERLDRTDASIHSLQEEIERIVAALHDGSPTGKAGLEALERALFEVVDHIELSDKRNADVLKTIQARLSDLANRVQTGGGLGADEESREAILEIEARIGDLARRVERAERSGGGDHAELEQKLAELAAKVDRARNNPAIEAIEARLNQVTSKLSVAERAMTPLSEVNQIKHEIGKLRTEVTRARDPVKPAVVHAIEARLKSIDAEMSGIRSTAASSTDLKKLGDRLETVVARLNSSETALKSAERIGTFEARLNSIGQRVEKALNEPRPHPQISALEQKVGEIATRIDNAAEPSDPMPAIAELRHQVNRISTRLDTAEGQFAVLESIEGNLSQLFSSIDSSRQAAIEAAEQAAYGAVQQAMASSGGSGIVETGDALTALERGLVEVKNQASTADKHNQETLEAIHDTLKQVIERVGNLEVGTVRPSLGDDAPSSPYFSRSLRTPHFGSDDDNRSDDDALDEFRLPPLHEAESDERAPATLDSQSVGARAEPPERERPSRGDSTDFSRAYDAPEPSLSHNEDFIAAARQAARAASQAQDTLDPTPEPDEGNSTGGIISRLRGRKRSLLFVAAALLIVAGTLSMTGIARVPFAVSRIAASADGPASLQKTLSDAGEAATAAHGAGPDTADANYFGPSAANAGDALSDAATPSPAEAEMAIPAPEGAPGAGGSAVPRITIAAPATRPGESVLSPRDRSPAASAEPARATTGLAEPMPAPGREERIAALAVDVEPTRSLLPLPAANAPSSLAAAAEAGDPAAQFEIASRFAEGRGERKDAAEAAVWFQRAAAQGLAPAQYRLGALYEKGQGVPQDRSAAQIWYQRAAEQGNVKAMHNLAVLLAGGTDGGADYARAARWFLRAAELGLADSQYNLAVLHERGLGIERDLGAAYKWFAIASAMGDAEAEKRMNALAGQLDPAALARASAAYQSWRAAPLDRTANFVELAPEFELGEAPRATAGDSLVARAQTLLGRLGYDPGPADGVSGPRTRDAISAFERDRGLPETGSATPGVIEHLESAAAG